MNTVDTIETTSTRALFQEPVMGLLDEGPRDYFLLRRSVGGKAPLSGLDGEAGEHT